MKIKFCGAAQTVTGSCHLLTLDSGFTVLLDCGLYQGRKEDYYSFNREWLFNPAQVDCMVLSHAHIDHSGRIPLLGKDGFKGTIYCTHATRDLTLMMLGDSAKIQERDAYSSNKRRAKRNKPQDVTPLYTYSDVVCCIPQFVGIDYDEVYQVNDEVSLCFKDCGHILGSANITVTAKDDNKKVVIGYTGDIGRPQRPILRDPQPMKDLDYLICESTYGARKHHDNNEKKDTLLSIIQETCVENKGKLLVPAFSVGRTQEIIYALDKLETEGKLPRIPVYIDSPMAIDATKIFSKHPECFDSEILDYMRTDPNPFGFETLEYVRETKGSKQLNLTNTPAIIISASGMITAGRILHHVFHNIENKNTTILLVGYCAPGTIGHQLRNGANTVRIFRKELQVKATIKSLESFSAHADQHEIIEFLSTLNTEQLKRIFLVHGEKSQQDILCHVMQKNGFVDSIVPSFGEEFSL